MSSGNESNRARPSENLKIDLRGIGSMAPGHLAADLLPQERRWPLVVGNLPALPENFQSREIATLLNALFPLTGEMLTYLILGSAGVGKSQAAAHAVRRGLDSADVELAIWITARNRGEILSVFAEAAHKVLNLSQPYPALQGAADLMLEWLSGTNRRWVVVLDDLVTPADAEGLWPSGPTGAVIVTSRSRKISVQGDDPGRLSWDRMMLPRPPII